MQEEIYDEKIKEDKFNIARIDKKKNNWAPADMKEKEKEIKTKKFSFLLKQIIKRKTLGKKTKNNEFPLIFLPQLYKRPSAITKTKNIIKQ